jgi:hypothetical protein
VELSEECRLDRFFFSQTLVCIALTVGEVSDHDVLSQFDDDEYDRADKLGNLGTVRAERVRAVGQVPSPGGRGRRMSKRRPPMQGVPSTIADATQPRSPMTNTSHSTIEAKDLTM